MRWYIAKFDGRKIPKVKEELGGYSPMVTKLTKPKNKKKPVKVHKPVFPGWIFLEEHLYGSEAGYPGFKGVVKYGRLGVLWLDEDDMELIRATDGMFEDHVTLHPGDNVEVGGLFMNRQGTVLFVYRDSAMVMVDGMKINVTHGLLRRISV